MLFPRCQRCCQTILTMTSSSLDTLLGQVKWPSASLVNLRNICRPCPARSPQSWGEATSSLSNQSDSHRYLDKLWAGRWCSYLDIWGHIDIEASLVFIFRIWEPSCIFFSLSAGPDQRLSCPEQPGRPLRGKSQVYRSSVNCGTESHCKYKYTSTNTQIQIHKHKPQVYWSSGNCFTESHSSEMWRMYSSKPKL